MKGTGIQKQARILIRMEQTKSASSYSTTIGFFSLNDWVLKIAFWRDME
jgi:hypothetical protein